MVSADKRYARIRAEREAALNREVGQLCIEGARFIDDFPSYFVKPSGVIYSTFGRRLLRLQPGIKPGGYAFVGLRNEAGTKYKMIHRIVAEAFIRNPLELPAVNHKDGNKLNNDMRNLEWCSHSHNIAHALATGLMKEGPEHHLAKLTAHEVLQIRAANGSYRQIGSVFGICAQSVCNIKNRKTYANVAEASKSEATYLSKENNT